MIGRRGIIVTLVLLAAAAASAHESRLPHGLGDPQYLRIDSVAVGRPYDIWVMLPDAGGENASEKYPTVYVLDGGALFPLLAAYYRYLNFGGDVPDVIIVGISYGSSSFEGGNYRSTDYTAPSDERDYWGGAGDFQRFLATELIPRVERDYPSRTDRRIVFGQSIGGQFVLYSALTDPDLFWGHIASNPALHRNLDFFLERHWEPSAKDAASRLFVASAENDDPVFRRPATEWMRHWSEADDVPWTLETMTLEGHSHMSAPPASFRAGMRWLFAE